MGPLVMAEHKERVAGYLQPEALGQGRVVIDGRGSAPAGPGFFLGPTLVDDMRPGSPVYDDEIFGPVLSVVRVGTCDEALALVNAKPLRQRRGHIHP